MSILVIAEHDNSENKSATLVTIAAAQAIGGDIDVLVAGRGVDGVAGQVAAIPGVSKVLVADNPAYEHQLAENIGDLIAEVAAPYGHVLAPHTASGKASCPASRLSSALHRSLTLSLSRAQTLSSVLSTQVMPSRR